MKEGKRMQKRSNEQGFTLIEVIVTLILVGITAALAGMWIVSIANGYIFAKMNASTIQKGQLAMARLSKELSAIQSISLTPTPPNGTSITFNRVDSINASGIPITISYDNNSKTLIFNVNGTGNNTLADSVSAFNLNYCDDNLTSSTSCSSSWSTTKRIIEVTLTLKGANNTPSTFTTRASPRNL